MKRFRNLTKRMPFIISAIISGGLIYCYFSSNFSDKTVNSIVYLILFFMTIANIVLRFTNDKRVDALTKKAESASKAKSIFLANMSHEIRTPMNAVIGLSELMPADNLNDTQKNYLRDIRKMSRAMLGIINDILDFSKIEAGRLEIIPVHFNLTTLYNEIVSMFSFMAHGKGLEFRTQKDEALPDIVYGDEIRIRQILINIINNAVKYTRAGHIDFRLIKEEAPGYDGYITAVVEDTGIGISKEDMPKLFGTFQRLDTNKNRVISGTGLGLAITKQLLEMLGGSIGIESEYKKGSRFTLRIPLTPGDALKVENETDISNFVVQRENASIKILAVDDSPVNLTVIKGYLAEHNLDADTSENGMEALFKITHNNYDIVFLDHMMPEMDGIETAKRIRALGGEYKNLPLIALSANAVSGARELFIESGMDDFILKPIDSGRLNAVLAKYLPPEKITINFYSASEHKPEFEMDNEIIWSDDDRKIFQEISLIDNLDAKEGITHTGNRIEDYFKVLRQFTGGVDKNMAKIKEYLQNKDWSNYAILVHAYRGTLAIIGADKLSELALSLETASKSIIEANNHPENVDSVKNLKKNLKLCREKTLPLCGAIVTLSDALEKTSLAGKTPFDKTSIEAAALKEKLTALKAACELFRADDADALSAELEKYTFSEKVDVEIQGICGLTAYFSFAEAAVKIQNLIETL
ncbi:MAG: response regulator [Spirochaetaceae bacterium]|jgi:signal transduction histidine kinase/CheY-like chemotaxis protein/HPt (histidine-containing phosphotransfer) domain-containing protein|nr:response regulator [Spirochaetaceae bacterium]